MHLLEKNEANMRKYDVEKRRVIEKREGTSNCTISPARGAEQQLAAKYYGVSGFPSGTFVFSFCGTLPEA